MKKIALVIIVLCSLKGFSQPYGNEWINYDQTYYSFPVAEDGVHQIDYNALLSSGIPIQNIDPRNIQIFAREKEIPILIEGESDGVFDSDDIIEFMAFHNDGWLDDKLYVEPEDHNNPHYSMFNDTLNYYITWNDQIDNRRVQLVTETNFSDYPAVNFLWKENIKSFHTNYWDQATGSTSLVSPYYIESEGWWGPRFGFPQGGGAPYVYTFQNPNQLSGPGIPAPNLTSVTCGRNNAQSSDGLNHHLRISYGNNNTLKDTLFSGFLLNEFNFSLDVNEMGSESTSFTHEVVNDLNLEADYIIMSWLSLRYPHQLRPDNATEEFNFEVPENSSADFQFMQLQSAFNSTGIIYTYGEESSKVIPQFSGDIMNALIPNDVNQKCFLTYPEFVKSVSNITPAGIGGQFTDFTPLELDSTFVIVTHPTLLDQANDYAAYRQSPDRDVLVVNINELYDQFGGGIEKHELSIRRFSDLILDSWANKPAHLFLLGKSVQVFDTRNNATNFDNNLVPTFGFPASDNLITAGLNGSFLEPAIPTGRISALTPDQVDDYLSKVMTFESQEPAEWMKNVMHFGGGDNAGQQSLFANFLNGYGNIIQDTCFGGNVHTFLKNSSLPIEVTLSDSIADVIADGTSILTFFGHANGSTFDFSIDQPENLTWNDRFPLFIGNSCFTGNIHAPGQFSTSEDYVLLPDKGAIAFIANVNLGFSSGLNAYTNRLYFEISKFSYGQSISDQMKNAVQNIQGNSNEVIVSAALGMTLEGDPSLIINSHEKPDISISEGDIIIDEAELNILSDSISVSVILTNIGKATNEPFEVELLRQFPGNQADSSYIQVVNGLNYKDTITYTIPLGFIQSIGINVFDVNIDLPANVLDELDDFSNNTSSTAILISEGSVLPGYPYNFSIVGEENISLKASTGNPFEESKTYRFEIDKNHLYNSSFFQSHEVTQTGGVLNWELPFALEDSTVYFWRVSVDSTATSPYQWNESSFQYIEDQEGWAQSDFFQKRNNEYNNLNQNSTATTFEFLSGSKELKCEVLGNSISQSEASLFRIDAEIIEYSGCQSFSALHVAVIDPLNLDVWGTNYNGQNPNNNFGQGNQGFVPCRQRVERYFIFQEHRPAQMDSLQSMLENKIPDGHYVLIYSWRHADHDKWDANAPWLYDKFEELGASEIANADNLLPFIFMTQMGSPESTLEIVGENPEDYIELYFDLERNGNSGRMRSERIGPAYSWDRIWWDTDALESADNDNSSIKILGVSNNGTEIEIPNINLDADITAEENLSSLIDPNEFPFIRLEGSYQDSITQTPAQQNAWHVNYGMSPESAINPQVAFGFINDTVQEGQHLEFYCAIENISAWDMDSLLVSYWVEDSSQEKYLIPYDRQDSLRAGESLIDTIQFNTTGLNGFHRFWIEVNPFNDSLNAFDQLEQYHFNNIAHLPFIVTEDIENPVLDVVFDGIHILDGELVSARPNIIVTLDDENPFLLMNEPSDTTFFSVFLTDPNGLQNRVNFTENEDYSLIFKPANGTDNIATLEYKPILSLDGQHSLLVIASDKSGNASGDLNYEINFEVDRESAVSEVLNYPNPFSTKTHFVFTLSGEFVPDNIKIQIMTITGKVVKTIFKEDLGPIRIGRNITDYFWDGRDEFGDRLANGTYIYRVIISHNGESVKYRETSASKFFKKGFGKMYLIR